VGVDIETVKLWISKSPESQRLEFKEAKNNFDREKLYKYCIAIANEKGGHLILGVSDVAPRRAIGTAAFQNLEEIEREIRDNTNISVSVLAYEIDRARILFFSIPSRPTGTAYQYKGAYFMRSGESLVTMGEDRLRQIFDEGREEWGISIIKSGLSQKDVFELIDYDTFEKFANLPAVSSFEERIDRFVNYRILYREGENFSISRIGAVALARDLSNFSEFIRKAPRLIVYNGRNKLDTRIDQTGRKGYAAGFQGLMQLCMQHIPQNEIVQDALRRVIPLFPERALREVVANALIHQDFTESGMGPVVEIYENRIEISNPGVPVVPTERFIDGYRSRNESFAWLMRQLNLCEERSSGIDRVIDSAEFFQLPAPEFIAGFNSTTVVIHGHRDFREMTTDDKVRACYQHCALRYVMRQQMTNDSLRQRFGIEDAGTISKILRATADAGLIATDPTAGASRKYARYVPSWSVSEGAQM
jgi:ATP-dependent DNA helicase RecG